MRSSAILFVALALVGCGKNTPSQPPPTAVPAADKSDGDEQAMLSRLKTDPQPLFDLASASVKKAVAEHAGDTSAEAATITVNKESLKTFGPDKWTVRGNLKADDKDGKPRDTTWEVEVRMMFGKLQPFKVRLDV